MKSAESFLFFAVLSCFFTVSAKCILFIDRDGDGFGGEKEIFDYDCSDEDIQTGYSRKGGDCNDNNPKVHPEAREICNGIDDNCNGEVDEGENIADCRPFYRDSDGDGFGIGDDSKCLCKPSGLFSAEKTGDCNDNNPAIYPGAYEYFDRLDNNCNGIIDENPGILPPPPRPKPKNH